jgi:hypothetical protein
MTEMIIPGIYGHFKGKDYKIICTEKDCCKKYGGCGLYIASAKEFYIK